MNKRLNNKVQMYQATETVCTQYGNAWSGNSAFTGAYTEFTTLVAGITGTLSAASAATNGITSDKATLHGALAEELYIVSSAVYAYASRTNNLTLRQTVDFAEADLDNIRQTDLLRIAGEVIAVAGQYIKDLVSYNITQTDVDALQQLATRYETAVPEPRAAVTVRMAAGDKLTGLVAQADDLLKNQMDRLVEPYRRTAPDFYNAYQNARYIVNYGTRHEKAATTKADKAAK